MRIEPVTNVDGKPIADNFVQLKDSFSERVMSLQSKLVSWDGHRVRGGPR